MTDYSEQESDVEHQSEQSSGESSENESCEKSLVMKKKCMRCGMEITSAPEKIYNHVKYCKNKGKKQALKKKERNGGKGQKKPKGRHQKWSA